MNTLTPAQINEIFKQCLAQEAKTGAPQAQEFVDAVIAHCPNCVSRFDEDEVPLFRQGAPRHELEGYVDAEFCTWAVAEIERLNKVLKRAWFAIQSTR